MATMNPQKEMHPEMLGIKFERRKAMATLRSTMFTNKSVEIDVQEKRHHAQTR